jgi:hypothetical protein
MNQQLQENSRTKPLAGTFPARTRRLPMASKLALSLAAVLALSAASEAARADRSASNSDQTPTAPRSPTNEEIDAAETGVPASVDYPNRETSKASPTNAEINAGEAGSPYSPDNKDQPAVTTDPNANQDWQKLESDNPHSTDHQD